MLNDHCPPLWAYSLLFSIYSWEIRYPVTLIVSSKSSKNLSTDQKKSSSKYPNFDGMTIYVTESTDRRRRSARIHRRTSQGAGRVSSTLFFRKWAFCKKTGSSPPPKKKEIGSRSPMSEDPMEVAVKNSND